MDECGSHVIPKLTMTARVTVTPISHSWVTGCLELAFSVGEWNDSPRENNAFCYQEEE